ncbi:thioredoxin-like protein [Fennellomyces sp. T-0311]|nr:thioredoxin-like protein [Fennellomyces sp. T-0311]
MDSLDHLDEQQKELLEQFQAVTQSDDLEASISRLSHYNWNLERAVGSVYEANSSHDSAREKLEQEVASSTQSASSSDNGTPTASSSSPRQQPSRPTPPPRPFRLGLFSLLTWPFGIAWNITWAILSFASRLLSRPSITNHSPSQQQQRQDPRSVAARFLREFEIKYGESHIDFYQGGYSQALENARRDLRYLLVVLQSDEHDDTEQFCRETLTSEELVNYVNEKNILVWGGNVREAEAFQVSSTLQATTYPFMAIITLQSPNSSSTGSLKMSVVDRIEGPASPSTVIRRFDTVIQRHGGALNRLRMERDQREMERRLRQEQDQAYRESLKADQEKERQAKLEREKAAKAEEEAKRAEQERLAYAEKRKQYIRYLCRKLPAEPTEGSMAKLSFRLADGERVIRKFKSDEPLEALYEFVEAYPLLKSGEHVQDAEAPTEYEHKYKFTIISPYPRTVYEPSTGKTLAEEKSLWPSATLIVDADDVEDDDEE